MTASGVPTSATLDTSARDRVSPRTFAPTPFPSTRILALARASLRELEHAFQRGVTPEIDTLVGWEFRGINCTPRGLPPIARLAGIQKFVKGMFRADDGRAMGYNTPVVQNVLDGRWRTRPSDEAPRRFGFYTIDAVDPTSRDNAYLHALLLDYGQGGNPLWDVSRGLRDYLVQLEDGDLDRLVGKAYYAAGPARVGVGFFLLERWRRGRAASSQ
ncbi:MAG: hypothetical protein H7138_06010 [Myxococcales bacterium]|nr:hypothetical protein [Myxococcales bacterium]